MKKYPITEKSSKGTLCDEKKYVQMYEESVKDPKSFWDREAKRITWFKEWDKTFEFDYVNAHVEWFRGASLNVSYNCIDRHLEKNGDKVAILWEDDSGKTVRKITYKQLHKEVCRFANVLKKNGVKKGDRITIYMGMIPELAIAMLACARIGAIHSVIFGGFSQEAIKTRALDSKCKMMITANIGLRGGKKIPLKETVDKGIDGLDFVEKVIVVKRDDTAVPMKAGRDFYYDELSKGVDDNCEAVALDSEDPLFILYTSGSTGKPKGVLHTQGGYLVYVSITHQYVFDLRPDDIYFCAADIGWVTGHSYIVYGPLSNAATTVMFESLPTYPDPGRYWQMVEKHKITIIYTAPTALRTLEREDDDYVNRHDTSSLRLLGTVGEPINHEAWVWYHEVVGKKQCNIVDTWWQTETGAALITPLPGAIETKPGSATKPFFGVQPLIVDESGKEKKGNNVEGLLCIRHSWPGQMRTVYGDHDRFKETYFSKFPGLYFTGDGCRRDEDGYYWITGRVDDVLNISGHRFGTAELEDAVTSCHLAVEAAVVGAPHKVKGQSIFAFCILQRNVPANDDTKKQLCQHVSKTISPTARPDHILFVPGLPKTRSGKIMRRILRKISSGELSDFGDISTLADPSIVEKMVEAYKADKVVS